MIKEDQPCLYHFNRFVTDVYLITQILIGILNANSGHKMQHANVLSAVLYAH